MHPAPPTTPDPAKAKIIARIRRALALANDRAGTPEGETAARIAANIMAEHAIEMEDVDAATREAEDGLTVLRTSLGRRSTWGRELFFLVCRHCTCRGVVGIGTDAARIYGHAHDTVVAEYLFEIIQRQIVTAAQAYTAQLRAVGKEKPGAFNDFCTSAVVGVDMKLERIRAEQRGAAPAGTALILARAAKVEEFFNANMKNASVLQAKKRDLSPAGLRAGLSVSLNAGVGAGEQQQPRMVR